MRNVHAAFRGGCTSLQSHQQRMRAPFPPHPHQRLLSLGFLMMAVLTCDGVLCSGSHSLESGVDQAARNLFSKLVQVVGGVLAPGGGRTEVSIFRLGIQPGVAFSSWTHLQSLLGLSIFKAMSDPFCAHISSPGKVQAHPDDLSLIKSAVPQRVP